MDYFLKATGQANGSNDPIVDYVAERYIKKTNIWQWRNNILKLLKDRLLLLLSVYQQSQGNIPLSPNSKNLYYKSVLAHQGFNVLMGSKLTPDFIDYAPLGANYDRVLLEKTRSLTEAHKVLRYCGDFDNARLESKKDLIWGQSFIEMCLKFNKDRTIKGTEYMHAPFEEMRGYYGDTDIIRVINYPLEVYAGEYGEEELRNVAVGGIVSTQTEAKQSLMEFKESVQGDVIQVIRYYNPARKIFAEIHGGNGHVYHKLEGDAYPLTWYDDKAFDPFLENRFYEDPNSTFFGWGIMDFLIDLANLETSITNAVASDALWDASSPTILSANDPDRMQANIKAWEKNRSNGTNRIIIDKASNLGLKGTVQRLDKGYKSGMTEEWDKITISRATRGSNIDFQSLSEYAPTAEQQKLKKIEADKLNLRVLLVNEQREKSFAEKEMWFLRDTKTDFHNQEIDVVDAAAEDNTTEDGFVPALKVKIGDILKDTKDLRMRISPRMEGALDDMTYLEIQEMQQDLGIIPEGTQAQIIALEQYLKKKNPSLNLTRKDFVTPAQGMAEPAGMPGVPAPINDLSGVNQQLATV